MKRAKNVFNKENLKELAKPTKKKIIISGAVLVVVIIAASALGKSKSTSMNSNNGTDMVTRGDIEVTITGSAAVEPYERFEIIPKVSGDITYCPYEVGDEVLKDDILYQFDSSNSDLTVERQRISMQQSEMNYQDALEESEKLSIKAKNNGVISGLTVKVGQEISAGTKIATVDDTTLLEVDLPFTQSQIGSIGVGDIAQITSSKHMSTVTGTVTHKATSPYAGQDGSALYNVTIAFENPGAFYAGMVVGGSVGGNISPGSGTVSNTASGTVSAQTEGTVSKIYYSNGDYVKKGTVIMTLTSDAVNDKIESSTLSYRSAKLSMEQTEKDLEDYSIKSPINGTVITKSAKEGDTIDKTNSASTLMVVADISKLKFDLAIDELDVGKVEKGQEVQITCDAVPDEEFKGIITNVSVEGTAQNGVTTYTAEVEIPEPGNLRPSMNIDASIIVESASNVLMVPTADIKTMGRLSYVFVKGKVESQTPQERPSEKGDDIPVLNRDTLEEMGGERPEGMGAPPEGTDERAPMNRAKPEGMGEVQHGKPNGGERKFTLPEAPEGFSTVIVQTGIANEDYTEIVSGLSEGQEVYSQSASSSSNRMTMGGMSGGMGSMGGGMPGGMGGRPGGMR